MRNKQKKKIMVKKIFKGVLASLVCAMLFIGWGNQCTMEAECDML